MKKTEYNHGEAFCLMTYICGNCKYEERLWNSRDGVTPFIIPCPECDEAMTHHNWNEDICNPTYIPYSGQRVFIDTPKELRAPIARQIASHIDNFFGEEDPEKIVQSLIDSYRGEEPYIITWH